MPSLDMMRQYANHVVAGEFEAAMGFWADDIVAHVSGSHVLSGTYKGKEAAAGYLAQAVAMADSVEIDNHDLLVSDDHAVALSVLHVDRGDRHLDMNRVVIYHTEGDLITELWIIEEDQKAADEFMA